MKEYNTNPKQWKSRFSKAKGLRSQWESNLREAYDLFLPDRDAFNTEQKGNNRRLHLWDDSGAQALQQFVNQLKNKLLPSQQKFSKLVTSGKVESEIVLGLFDSDAQKELQIELDKNNAIMFNYLWDSNFDTAVLESLQDMAISTGALMIQETGDLDNPLNFISVPVDQLVIEEDNTGDVKNVWREWCVKAEEIPILWKDYKRDKNLQKIIEDKPTNKINIIEGTVYDAHTGKYHYGVYTDSAECKFIFESKYSVSPWVIFRWNKSAGETWGRGPALSCKPSMSMLNQLKSDLLRNNAVHINPPAIIASGAFVNPARVKIAPNQRIIVKSNWDGSKREPVSFLQNNTNFQLGQGMANEFRQDVREAFYLDFLGGVNDPVRSATEISIRSQQMLEQQISAFSRLKRELIDKVIRRVYYILKRLGLVENLDIDGKVVNVKATSPLSQAQDMKDVEGLMQYFSTMLQLGGEQGMVMAAMEVDVEAVPAFFADKFDVPAALRMDEAKKKKQAQLVQQAMAQQQPQQPM